MIRKPQFYWMYLALFLVLQMASQPAMASGLGIAPSHHDIFGEMLQQIFGNKAIPTVSGIARAQVDSWTGSIVSMLAWINTIVLFVGGVLASYTIFGSILKSARTGQVMGNWNEHTVPIRTLLGAAVLLPVPGFAGLSAIQIIVIWLFTMVGIGAADTGWDVIIPDLAHNALGTLVVPRSNIRQLAGSVLQSQVCEQAVNYELNDLHLPSLVTRSGPTEQVLPTIGATVADNPAALIPGVAMFATGDYVPTYSAYVWGTPAAATIAQFMPLFPASGLTDVCGTLQYESGLKYVPPIGGGSSDETIGSQLRSAVYAANDSALPTLLNSIHPLATDLSNDKTPSSAAWNSAIDAYDTALVNATKSKAEGVFASGIKQYTTDARKYGFATAGEWFWKINSWNQAAEEALNEATSDNMSVPSWGNYGGELFSSHYRAEMKRAAEFVNEAHSTGQGLGGQPTPTEGSGSLASFFAKAGMDTVDAIVQAPVGENPIEHIQSMGTIIENFGGALFAGGVAAIAAGKGVDHSVAGDVGGGLVGGPAAFLGTLATHLAEIIFGAGFLLSFFVPLIPYLIFTLTLLTTAILAVEFVAAAPIWAAMHMHPEGHEFFGHGSQGYGLALSIVFRPLLMLVGFLAGTGLVYAFAFLLNATLGNAIISAMTTSGSGFLGPMDFIGSIILYTGFLVMAVWKSYELIFIIPDKVMRWANAQGAQTDDANLVAKAQQHGSGVQRGEFAGNGVGRGLNNATGSAFRAKEAAIRAGGGRPQG
ncbi:DotA/TraY family protein [Acidithiobacillus sp. CV18-2]|nr:DotA/TraY family protein [Acidithiobacillus sp. CV18-3]MBU2756936.1 DotA/TraY family protein [Acidithiobacillus sp. BN09-2]MBU2777547.1 DotA/TraY family protein [Acidithiobacillus sp. CV18-2]MBU2799647.1 DotA/TraY family protein [Acidithiobacillus sp. VAN18-4]